MPPISPPNARAPGTCSDGLSAGTNALCTTAMATMIDTLHYADTFAEAGIEPRAAKALAHAFAEAHAIARGDLVTKDYLDHRLNELESRMDGKMLAMERRLEKAITETKFDMIKVMLGSQVALIAILAALANFTKLFSH